MCLEACLPPVAGCNANIRVASMEVKLGLDLGTAQLVEEVCDKWDQVPILLSDPFEVLEVNTESQGVILLLGKENWCTCWQLG